MKITDRDRSLVAYTADFYPPLGERGMPRHASKTINWKDNPDDSLGKRPYANGLHWHSCTLALG